jgi:hypothetical protein
MMKVRPFSQVATSVLAKFDRSGGPDACWPWLGWCAKGYGKVWWRGRRWSTHILAFILAYRVVPAHWGLCVLHSCDNPPCGNPKHLFLGTQRINVADMDAKGRRVTVGAPTGEGNGQHRLRATDVRAIRRLYSSQKSITQKDLARRFGVSLNSVSFIIRGITWVDI